MEERIFPAAPVFAGIELEFAEVLLAGSWVLFQQEVRDARKRQIGDPADQVQQLIHPLDRNPDRDEKKILGDGFGS